MVVGSGAAESNIVQITEGGAALGRSLTEVRVSLDPPFSKFFVCQ